MPKRFSDFIFEAKHMPSNISEEVRILQHPCDFSAFAFQLLDFEFSSDQQTTWILQLTMPTIFGTDIYII